MITRRRFFNKAAVAVAGAIGAVALHKGQPSAAQGWIHGKAIPGELLTQRVWQVDDNVPYGIGVALTLPPPPALIDLGPLTGDYRFFHHAEDGALQWQVYDGQQWLTVAEQRKPAQMPSLLFVAMGVTDTVTGEHEPYMHTLAWED